MPRTPANRPYHWLAQYYERLFSVSRAPLDLQREHVLGPILPQVTSACDLACGPATTALDFARRGIQTFAVDLSPQMCRAARENARRARLPVRVFRGDMRSFRLPRPVDLVTCEGDALNHVPHKDDLPNVARAVAHALRPGGWFYFDVNNRAGFRAYWTGTVWLERPGVVAVMRNGNVASSDHAWSDVEWFIRDGRVWRRRRERVDEVCWSVAEIRRALRDAGFDRVRRWDAAPFFKSSLPFPPGCRSVYLARKSRP